MKAFYSAALIIRLFARHSTFFSLDRAYVIVDVMSTSTSYQPTHYLVVTYPSCMLRSSSFTTSLISSRWAHIRSLIGLTINLLQINSQLYVTMLIPSTRSTAAAVEMAQYPPIENPGRFLKLHYGKEAQKTGGMWNPAGGYRNECEEALDPLTLPLAKVYPAVLRDERGVDEAQLEAIDDPITGESVTPHQIHYAAIVTDITLGTFANKVKNALATLHEPVKPPPTIGFGPYNTACLAVYVLIHHGVRDQS